jgi:hypothetical protein
MLPLDPVTVNVPLDVNVHTVLPSPSEDVDPPHVALNVEEPPPPPDGVDATAVTEPILLTSPLWPASVYCAHRYPLKDAPIMLELSGQANVIDVVPPEDNCRELTDWNVDGALEVGVHAIPVRVIDWPKDWPKLTMRLPLVYSIGLPHTYPAPARQEVPRAGAPLNTPMEKRTARTTAITRIAHPYVIRYSIADCAFGILIHLDSVSRNIKSYVDYGFPLPSAL